MSYTASQNHPAWVHNARFPSSKWYIPSKCILKKPPKVPLRGRCFQGKTQSWMTHSSIMYTFSQGTGRTLGTTKPRPLTTQMDQQGPERPFSLSAENDETAWWNENPGFLVLSFHIPYCLLLLTSLFYLLNLVRSFKGFFFLRKMWI